MLPFPAFDVQKLESDLHAAIVLFSYLLVVPMAPMLVMWMMTHLIDPFDPLLEHQRHLVTFAGAHKAAFGLAVLHGLLMLADMPGSVRGVRVRLLAG